MSRAVAPPVRVSHAVADESRLTRMSHDSGGFVSDESRLTRERAVAPPALPRASSRTSGPRPGLYPARRLLGGRAGSTGGCSAVKAKVKGSKLDSGRVGETECREIGCGPVRAGVGRTGESSASACGAGVVAGEGAGRAADAAVDA